MRYLKTFENLNIEPEVGDYVICETNEGFAKNVINSIISRNIGQIIKITDDYYKYLVYYDCDIPPNLKGFFNDNEDGHCRLLGINEIKHISKNKKDLEIILNANKYNL